MNNTDILKLLPKNNIDIADIDVVVGGPPCQGFSSVGKRMIDDPRNKLVKVYADIVNKIKPKMFLMENVSGLASAKNADNEFVKDELIEIFSLMNYTVKSKVLLAANFGVPQLRKRIFFVGIRNDYPFNFTFPESSHEKYLTVDEAISDLDEIDCGEASKTYKSKPKNDYQKYCRKNTKKVLNHEASKHSDLVVNRIKNIPQGGNHNDLPENLKLKHGYSNIYGKLDENRAADTITGNCGCASAPGRFLHPTINRVITVREASRLQSIPDYVEFKGSKTKQYKQVGNAVPPLLAKAIACEFKNSLASFS